MKLSLPKNQLPSEDTETKKPERLNSTSYYIHQGIIWLMIAFLIYAMIKKFV